MPKFNLLTFCKRVFDFASKIRARKNDCFLFVYFFTCFIGI